MTDKDFNSVPQGIEIFIGLNEKRYKGRGIRGNLGFPTFRKMRT